VVWSCLVVVVYGFWVLRVGCDVFVDCVFVFW